MKGKHLKPWVLTARPKTLFAGISPVLIGLGHSTAISQSINWSLAIFTLLCTVAMQVGTNFVNDYYDAISGVDDNQRLGPLRAIHQKLITIDELKSGYRIVFTFAFLTGLILIWNAGLPILIIGLCSLLFAYIYTAGPFPLSHYALGEITAFLFFGPIAVWGTIYIQSPSPQILYDLRAWSLGVGPGLISATIMGINNLRDLENDKSKSKNTIAVFLGKRYARLLCLSFVALSVLWAIVYAYSFNNPLVLTSGFSSLIFLKTWKGLLKLPLSSQLNYSLAQTGKYLFLYSLLFSVGLVLNAYV